jgi:hypothetical protein
MNSHAGCFCNQEAVQPHTLTTTVPAALWTTCPAHLYWQPLSTCSLLRLKSDSRHSYTAPSAPADTMLLSLADQQMARTCNTDTRHAAIQPAAHSNPCTSNEFCSPRVLYIWRVWHHRSPCHCGP